MFSQDSHRQHRCNGRLNEECDGSGGGIRVTDGQEVEQVSQTGNHDSAVEKHQRLLCDMGEYRTSHRNQDQEQHQRTQDEGDAGLSESTDSADGFSPITVYAAKVTDARSMVPIPNTVLPG